MDWNRGKPPSSQYPGAPRSGPPANNSSIFGLISKVNKGILKKPSNQGQDHAGSSQSPSNAAKSRQSRQSPQHANVSPVSKDHRKETVFLEAKSKIEQIQRGLWKSGSKSTKPEPVADPFKVPTLPIRAAPQKTKTALVEYDDDEDDHTDRSSSFSKKKALEEIDRYIAAPKYASKLFSNAEKESSNRASKDRPDYYQQPYRNTETYSQYDNETLRKNDDSYFDAYNVVGAQNARGPDRDFRSRTSDIDNTPGSAKLNKYSASYDVFDYGQTSEDGRQSKPRRFEETKSSDGSNKDKSISGSYRHRTQETGTRFDSAKSKDKDFVEPKTGSYRDERGREDQSKRVFRESKSEESSQSQWERTSKSISPIPDQGYSERLNLDNESRDRSSGYPNYPGYDRNTSKQEPYNYPPKSESASSEPFNYYSRKYEQGDQTDRDRGPRKEEEEPYKEQFNWGYNDNRRQVESGFSIQQPAPGRGNRRDSESSKGSASGEMLYEDFLFKDNKKDNGSDKNRQHSLERDTSFGSDKQRPNLRDSERRREGDAQNLRDYDKQREGYSQSFRDSNKQRQGGSQNYRDFNDPDDNYVDERDRYSLSHRNRFGRSSRDYNEMEQDRYSQSYGDYSPDKSNPDDRMDYGEDEYWREKRTGLNLPNWPGSQDAGSAVPVQAIIADPGLAVAMPQTMAVPAFFCKDCNMTFFDQDVYETHMKSDSHLLVLQKRAQELFQLNEGGRKSRFDVMEPYPLTQVQVPLTPVTMVAGVAPPQPKGPLQAENVSWDSLTISWGRLTGKEASLVEKYVVEYRNARETRWATVGYTNKFDFNVDGLQENTDYLFRVFSMNGMEKSEVLESVLITTRRKRDANSRRPVRPSPERIRTDRDRDRGNRDRNRSDDRKSGPDRDRDRRSSLERGRDRKSSLERDKDRKSSLERDKDRSRKSSREKDKDRSKPRGSSNDKKTSDNKDDKRDTSNRKSETDSKNKTDPKGGKDSDRKDSKESARSKEERDRKDREKKNYGGREKVEDKKKSGEKVKIEEVDEVECMLYREIGNIEEQPLLGLEYLWEIVSYKPTTPIRYLCKLCNTKGNASRTMMNHICGLPHKIEYFKKHDQTVYDTVSMIALKQDQIDRVNYEAQIVEDMKGRGAVRVMIMLNPQDTDGKVTYKDPVEVKAPPPNRGKITEPAPKATIKISKFWSFLDEAINVHGCEDTTVIGLSYLKEYIHPYDEEPPRYTCKLCNIICTDKTVVFHVIGRKHRAAYLKIHNTEFWETASKSRDVKKLISEKVKEIHAKEGPGDIKSMVPKNSRLWRHSMKKDKGYGEGQEDTGVDVTMGTNQGDTMEIQGEGRSFDEKEGVKFGIKKTDQSNTNVNPVNVLDQDKPKTKEPFDWNKENAALQAKIQNQTIIKSNRKAKFITVYSEFFKRYPVIGLQWVTEFQKPDPKLEPWYMCFMCQQKLQWKNVLDHVTSSSHRIAYMKKNYEAKYKDLRNIINANKSKGRAIVESHSRDIVAKEGVASTMEVMLELSVNKEALKSVMKVKDSVKSMPPVSKTSEESQNIGKSSTADMSKPVLMRVSMNPSVQQPPTSLIPGLGLTSVGSMFATSVPGQITQAPSTLSQQQLPSLMQQQPLPTAAVQQALLQTATQAGQVPNLPYTGYGPSSSGMSVQPQYQQGVYNPATVTQTTQPMGQQGSFMPNQTGCSTNLPPTAGYQPQVSMQGQLYGQAITTPATSSVPPWQTSAQQFPAPTQTYPPNSLQGQLQPTSLLSGTMHPTVPLQGQMQPSSSIANLTQPGAAQQLGNTIQTVIEKQAERVITQQILQTGQFPDTSVPVSVQTTDTTNLSSDNSRNRSQSYDRQGNNQGAWMGSDWNDSNASNRDQMDRGEKRSYGQRENDWSYKDTKRNRRDGNNRFSQNSGRYRESRFDNVSSHSQRSDSPYDERLSRGYRDNERLYDNNEGRDDYDRRGNKDNNDRWSRSNTEGSYSRGDNKSDTHQLHNTDTYEDDYQGEEDDYDLPLSPKELENLVQMYCDRPEENEDFDEFNDEYNQSESRSQSGSRYDDYPDSRDDYQDDNRDRGGYSRDNFDRDNNFGRHSTRDRQNPRSQSRFDSPKDERMVSGEERQYGGYDRQGGRQQYEDGFGDDSRRSTPSQGRDSRERDQADLERDRRIERDRSPRNERAGSGQPSRSEAGSRSNPDKFGSRSRSGRRSRWSDIDEKSNATPGDGMSERGLRAQDSDVQSRDESDRQETRDVSPVDDSYPDPSMEEIEKLLRRGTSRIPARGRRGNRDGTRNMQQGQGSSDMSYGNDQFRDNWKPYGDSGGGSQRGAGPIMMVENPTMNMHGNYGGNNFQDNQSFNQGGNFNSQGSYDNNMDNMGVNRQSGLDFDDRQYSDRVQDRGGYGMNDGQNWQGRGSMGRGNFMRGQGGMNRGR